MNQLDNITDSEFSIGEISKTAWIAPPSMTFEQWQEFGNTLQTVQGSINWWIGDWLNEGERRYGETYAQAVEVTGWDVSRLQNAKWVSSAVRSSTRVEVLSWTAHREVANLPDDEQEHWLNRATNNGWNSRQLKEAIKEYREKVMQQSNGYHKAEPLPSNYKEPTEYLAALWSADGDSGDPPDTPNDNLDEWQPTKNVPHVSHNSGNNEWYTPPDYIQAAYDVLGVIDLDPASSEIANTVIKAAKIYTKEDDGLMQYWQGSVWLNPPYAKELIGEFVNKLCYHLHEGDVTEAILLVNNATETAWFGQAVAYASVVCFPSSRARYWQADGTKGQPLQGQAILYFGDSPELFTKAFRSIGWLSQVLHEQL